LAAINEEKGGKQMEYYKPIYGEKEAKRMENQKPIRIPCNDPVRVREFWAAFLVVFNHYLVWELGLFSVYREGRRPPQEVVEAVQLLGCWRDEAHLEGWAEEQK
jgi:hypothetical protein